MSSFELGFFEWKKFYLEIRFFLATVATKESKEENLIFFFTANLVIASNLLHLVLEYFSSLAHKHRRGFPWSLSGSYATMTKK